MVNLMFLSKMQVSSDKQIPGLVKSNGNGDFIDGCQEKRSNDGLLRRRRHSENVICGCQNNVRKHNSEIKDVKTCIKLPPQITQNIVDNKSLVSPLITTNSPQNYVEIKYKPRMDSASKYTMKRRKNIKREVCTKCKEILKYIDRFLNNNNEKIMIGPRQNHTEIIHNNGKLNNQSDNLDISNEQNKTCVDAKQNERTNVDCQSILRLDKSRCGIGLNNNKSTSKENSTNNKKHDENKIEQSVSSNKTLEKNNSTVVCNKPVSSKFNSDAMCYFVDLDNTCPSYVCPDKCRQLKPFCFRKKINVGTDTDSCYKKPFYNRIGSFFSYVTAKFRSRQNNQNIECSNPLKDRKNQTKKLTINIKKEPVCIVFENASGCNDRSPDIFGKVPKKKVAFHDECINLPKGLVAIKIDPNNKRVINKRELKCILKSLPKREVKNCPISASTSKVEVQTILKQKSSPIATACKGPMFVIKIDRNNMRILNYPEVKCKISNLNKMCTKNPDCESWVVTKGKCRHKKQKVRSVESKMSLWDRYHRSKSKSPSAPIKKKHSQGKIYNKPSKKSSSDFKLFSKVNRRVKKKQRSKSGSIITKHVRGKRNKKGNKKVAHKKNIVKKRSCTPPKKPKCPKRKTKQKIVIHKKSRSAKGLKKHKSSKNKNKKKKSKTRRRIKKSKSVFKKCCLLFKDEIKIKRKKRKSSKPKKKKSKSKPVICKNKDKSLCCESNFEKCQYDYLKHTKTPCLWLFVTCPFLHRNYMMFRSIFHDCTRCMLLMLALVFWCPCFLCIELFRCFCT